LALTYVGFELPLGQVGGPAQVDHQGLATDPIGRPCRPFGVDNAHHDVGTESGERGRHRPRRSRSPRR
jgi:hypothetical protein